MNANPMTPARHLADCHAADGHGRMVNSWLAAVALSRALGVPVDPWWTMWPLAQTTTPATFTEDDFGPV